MNNITDYPLVNDPSYINLYNCEKFDIPYWRNWLKENWTLSMVLSAIYTTFIIVGQKWMKNREPFRLRKLLLIWNVGLATFSIVAFSQIFPETWNTIMQPQGFHKSICSREGMTYTLPFWMLLGIGSKVFEFGDTFFIVLRKQSLIFLHPYHHVTVMVYCWITYESLDPSMRWFGSVNMFIHSCMYTYYALRATGKKVPRQIAMSITIIQIMQMIVGTIINIYSLKMLYPDDSRCDRDINHVLLSLVMYATYFYLFVDFFRKSYFKKTKFD